MKIFFSGLIALFLTNLCFAETSDHAASITAKLREGTCSLKDYKWCPTYAENTTNGFVIHATSKSVKNIMDLNYRNLTPYCMIWKFSGGRENAIAQLAITDENGIKVVISRVCVE